MSEIYNLIVIIDDDVTNNLICESLLYSAKIAKTIKSFDNVEEGLAFIKKIQNQADFPAVIFLDLNFPEYELNGWDFLLEYKEIVLQKHYKCDLYILTSSISKNDIKKAKNENIIADFISKPLSKEKILKLLNK